MPIPKKKEISIEVNSKGRGNNNSTNNDMSQSKKEIYDFNDEEWQDEEILDVEDVKKSKGGRRSLGIYRKIAVSFVLATLLLFGFIAFLYMVKVTITITPNKEKINTNVILDVLDTEKFSELKNENSIFGVVKEFEIEHSRDFETTGKRVIDDEITGEVEVVNNYTKTQPLVASTRLLTPDNKLFRIKETVSVPAGKSVMVEVYTDKPSKEFAVEPTTFVIPGLWSGIQDKIFARNDKAFIYQENAKRFVTNADILDAKEMVKEEILAKAEKEVGAMYSEYDKFIYKLSDDINETINVNALDETDTFGVKMTAKVSIVAFNNEPIEELAQTKISNELADGAKLVQIFEKSIEHHLDNYSTETGIASVNSFFSGNVAYNKEGTLFEKEKILGLTKKQLEEYLKGLPSIKNYTIRFQPGFIERVPNVIDRIEILVK